MDGFAKGVMELYGLQVEAVVFPQIFSVPWGRNYAPTPKSFRGARTYSRSSITMPSLVGLAFQLPPGRPKTANAQDDLLKKWRFTSAIYSGYILRFCQFVVWSFLSIPYTKIIKIGSFLTAYFEPQSMCIYHVIVLACQRPVVICQIY